MTLTADSIVGIVGILPSPATEDAANWDAENTVNLSELEKLTRIVVAGGTEIIMTTGTFGEGGSLTWPELKALVDCVVQNAAGRPVFAGVTTLNTRDTIRRARTLIALGASGLFVGRPMWLGMDQSQIVRYYRDLVAALPGVPLVIYDNPHAFKGKISTEAYQALAAIPQVVAAKHVGGPELESDMLAVGTAMRVLPLETQWTPIAERLPELARASWSGNVACAPYAVGALGRSIAAGDWTAARALHAEMKAAVEPSFAPADFDRFMNYSVQLGNARFRAAGVIKPGPTRPPYLGAPADLVARSEEVGRRWAALEQRYAPVTA